MNPIFTPGSRVRHKDIKLAGTVLSCINEGDKSDRLIQSTRYYVATSVDVWSIPHSSLKLITEGHGLSDYHKNRYAKYLKLDTPKNNIGPNSSAPATIEQFATDGE